jgi:hypothetical protein
MLLVISGKFMDHIIRFSRVGIKGSRRLKESSTDLANNPRGAHRWLRIKP